MVTARHAQEPFPGPVLDVGGVDHRQAAPGKPQLECCAAARRPHRSPSGPWDRRRPWRESHRTRGPGWLRNVGPRSCSCPRRSSPDKHHDGARRRGAASRITTRQKTSLQRDKRSEQLRPLVAHVVHRRRDGVGGRAARPARVAAGSAAGRQAWQPRPASHPRDPWDREHHRHSVVEAGGRARWDRSSGWCRCRGGPPCRGRASSTTGLPAPAGRRRSDGWRRARSGSCDRVELDRAFPTPFVEGIGRNDAAVAPERGAEGRRALHGLGACVDQPRSILAALGREEGNQPPAEGVHHPLAVVLDHGRHLIGRCDVEPIARRCPPPGGGMKQAGQLLGGAGLCESAAHARRPARAKARSGLGRGLHSWHIAAAGIGGCGEPVARGSVRPQSSARDRAADGPWRSLVREAPGHVLAVVRGRRCDLNPCAGLPRGPRWGTGIVTEKRSQHKGPIRVGQAPRPVARHGIMWG